MLSATEFRRLVSGERKGLVASLWRGTFAAAEIPYGLTVRVRNRQFDRGSRAIARVGVPVVSVGNITVGGTGKTPMVEWLAKWFRQQNVRVTLISRGYGAEAGARNDEALELEFKLPDVPHLQNPDRVAAAELAIEEFETQLILLDDGFQHRRLHRDLDIVLLDAIEPFGYGHLLPRGMLRESPANLRRADIVALTRADAVDQNRRDEIRDQVRRHANDADWIEVSHRPCGLLSSRQVLADLENLRDRPVAAFCGIGNPAGFRHSLEASGLRIASFREFPDHHAYTAADVRSLAKWSNGIEQAEAVVCTHKDLVKVGTERLGELPLWALAIQMEVLRGRELLEQRLQAALDHFPK